MQVIKGIVQTLPQQIRGEIKPTVASSGEEYQKGYDEGYEIGKKESYDIGFADGEAEGFEKGSAKGEMLIYNLNISFDNMWHKAEFPENTELVLKRKNVCDISSAFSNITNLKSVKLIADNIDETATLNFNSAFRECPNLEVIDLTEFGRKVNNIQHFVYNSNKLKSILGALDVSAVTRFDQMLGSTSPDFKDVEFVPNSIKVSLTLNRARALSDKSIQSIIDGLADLTGQTAQTITWHTTVFSKLTEEQFSQIANKNWRTQ